MAGARESGNGRTNHRSNSPNDRRILSECLRSPISFPYDVPRLTDVKRERRDPRPPVEFRQQRTSESERTTRQERIDPKLHASGWIVTPYRPAKPLSLFSNHAITEYPTANGPADYALVVDGSILGIVEAKKLTVSPSGASVEAAATACVCLSPHDSADRDFE